MRKTALAIIILFVFVFSGFSNVVFSQEPTFEQAYQAHILAQQTYATAFSDYQKAKSFYQKNQTLTLREDARKKALVMLRARDEVVGVYLNALRAKILEIDGLEENEKNSILGKIDSELLWYSSHKAGYQETDSLEDLFNKSKEVESRYKTDTPVIFYDALFNISLSEVVALRVSHEKVFTEIKGTLNKNEAEGKLQSDPFARWLTDIDSVISSLKINEASARKEMAKMYKTSSSLPEKTFTKAVEPFLYSTALLKQFNGYLGEFWGQLKTSLND